MSGITEEFPDTATNLTRTEVQEILNNAFAKAQKHFLPSHVHGAVLSVGARWNLTNLVWPGGNDRAWFGVRDLRLSVGAGRWGGVYGEVFTAGEQPPGRG